MSQMRRTRRDLEVQLIERAWRDPSFRRELLADARAVIERELQTHLPDRIEIRVVEETPERLYLVLPVRPEAGEGVLADEELEDLAGGFVWGIARLVDWSGDE